MKTRFILFFILLFSIQIIAKPPRMAKYPVGNSGIQLYFPAKPSETVINYSEDSSIIYTVSCLDTSQNSEYFFEAIVVKLKEDIKTQDHIDDIVIPYLDFLQKQFIISNAAGYGKGHTLSTHPSAIGVIDYWADDDAIKYNVTAWAAEKYIVVLFVYGVEDYPIFNIVEMFKKGVRFPGD